MTTVPVRVPEEVHSEVQTAARVLGCSSSALLERAWLSFSRSPEFVDAFQLAQEALSDGRIELVALRLRKEVAGTSSGELWNQITTGRE